MSARKPPALQKGDTIAIVSPSARKNTLWPWRVERATAFLEREGYAVKVMYNADVPYSPLSANAAGRAEELHAAFRDPSVKAIICGIGGSTISEVLPELDPELVRNNPKIVSGMSDNTLLHHFCYANGLRPFYGPSALTQLGEWPQPLEFTWKNFLRAVTVPEPMGPLPCSPEYTDEVADRSKEPEQISNGTMRPRTMKPSRGWRWLQGGRAEGEVWGGCLPSLFQLMNTKWEVSYQGKIAFIEIPKAFPLEVAISYIQNMRLQGIMDQIVGLIVGRPPAYSLSDEQQWDDSIVRLIEGFDFPVLAGVDVGHTDPMLTVPLGAMSRLDSSQDVWEILESGVSANA